MFGVALVVTLVLGFRAARRRNFARHRVWMIRSFAIALVAGTQVFTLGFGGAIFGTGDLAQALMLVAAWGDQPRGRGVGDPSPRTSPPSCSAELGAERAGALS